MKRKVFDWLKRVDKEEGNILIIVSGMMGTGKTYGVLEYVKKEYSGYLYIDAAHNRDFSEYFASSEGKSLKAVIAGFFNIDEEYLQNIPVIIDEPAGIIAPRFLINRFEYDFKLFILTSDILSINHLVKGNDDSGLAAGLVEIAPLNFGEFLVAIDKEWYEEIIEGHLMRRRRIPELIHQELLDLYDLYMQIGGMPEIINEYIRLGTAENVRERQCRLRDSLWFYLMENAVKSGDDPSSPIQGEETVNQGSQISWSKVGGLLDAVERILEKDNHKFMYSAIRDGVSRRLYEKSLEYLVSGGTLMKIDRLSEDGGRIESDFRLYFSDISLYERPSAGKIAESSMIQGLCSSGLDIYYWESGKGASLDAVAKVKDELFPIDFHISGKGSRRSIGSYFGNTISIRLAEENCRFEENKITIPVYAAYALKRVVL